MGKSSLHYQSTQQDDVSFSKMKGSVISRTSGSMLAKNTNTPFGISENFSILKGTHAIQKSEQVELSDEQKKKFAKEAKAFDSAKHSVMPASTWNRSKDVSDELDMQASQFKKSQATDKQAAFDLNESSLLIQPTTATNNRPLHTTLDYLPLAKNKRFQSVNARSHEKRPMFETDNAEASQGNRLKRYDEMIKHMQTK